MQNAECIRKLLKVSPDIKYFSSFSNPVGLVRKLKRSGPEAGQTGIIDSL
jgi:hypothetical protein